VQQKPISLKNHIKIQYFDRLGFVALNIAFYFNKDNAISKSSKANINDAVIAAGKVLSTDEKIGEYLIDADGLKFYKSKNRLDFSSRHYFRIWAFYK
jgi:hypothetical protein